MLYPTLVVKGKVSAELMGYGMSSQTLAVWRKVSSVLVEYGMFSPTLVEVEGNQFLTISLVQLDLDFSSQDQR